MAEEDIYGLFAADEATAQEKAAAMAAALRGQRAQAQAFAMHPLLAKMGQTQLGDIQAREEMLAKAGQASSGERMRAALAAQRRQQELADEASRREYEVGRDVERHKNNLDAARIQAGITAGFRAQDRAESAAIRQQQKEEDAARRAQERADAEEAKKRTKMIDVDERANAIRDNIAELRRQIEDYGTYEVVGPQNANADRLLTAIATDSAKLMDPESAAQKGEVDREKAALGLEPTPWAKADTQLKILDELEKSIEARRERAYKVRGLEQQRTGKLTPGGKPYAKKQYNEATKKYRYLGADGKVVE